jgi:hypothetical protein
MRVAGDRVCFAWVFSACFRFVCVRFCLGFIDFVVVLFVIIGAPPG